MEQEESSQKKRESERREKMGVGRDVSGFIRLLRDKDGGISLSLKDGWVEEEDGGGEEEGEGRSGGGE